MAQVFGLAAPRRRERVAAVAEEFDLHALYKQRAGTLSGGQRQRLALAAATLHEPELLLLDEPTSAVDPQSRRDFWESLFALVARGVTILVSTHYMDEAERCHELAILAEGRIVAQGEPQRLMSDIPAAVVEVEAADTSAARRALLAGSRRAERRATRHAPARAARPCDRRSRRTHVCSGCATPRSPRARSSCARAWRTCSWRPPGSAARTSPPVRRRTEANTPCACVILAIMSKEVRQLARDRLTFGMIIGIPLMQILLFGYAINFDVRDLRAAVVDEARTSHSRALIADLQATGVIDLGRAESQHHGSAPAHGPRGDQRGDRDPARLRAPAHGQRPSRRPDPGRRLGADGRRRRAGARFGAVAGPGGRVFPIARTGVRSAHGVQPGATDRRAGRAGADRGHPQHDHGDLHCGGDRPRTRARQPRAADRHPGPVVGADEPASCCRTCSSA